MSHGSKVNSLDSNPNSKHIFFLASIVQPNILTSQQNLKISDGNDQQCNNIIIICSKVYMGTATKNKNENLLGAIIFRNFPISYLFPESFEGSIFFQLPIPSKEQKTHHPLIFAQSLLSHSHKAQKNF